MSKEKPKELKIALVIDSYKLADLDKHWKKCLARTPDIERDYELVKGEIGAGVTKSTTTCYRYYKLREKK